MSLGFGQQQVQFECVVGLDDRGHLLFVQPAKHFFGQRQAAGSGRQLGSIAGRGQVDLGGVGAQAGVDCGGLGGHGSGDRLAAAFFRLRRRGELQGLVDAVGEGVERTHLHLQAARDRLQRLAAQLRQVSGAAHLVDRFAMVEAGSQLQRDTL
ncbi:hypothetical protein D3C80_1657630 [compost metagenome]